MQLEKYSHHDDEQQELTIRETNWKVLGWSIQRANELESLGQKLSSTPMEMRLEAKDELFLTAMEHQAERPGLPVSILNQLEQFYVSEVSNLQKGTQAWYSRTMETLFQYLSLRFGQSFEWSLLTEDVLARFFSVWYLDHHQSTPISARIFLNSCKHLFRWLNQAGHIDVFEAFKKVYVSFIRLLPEVIEVHAWMMKNGVMEKHPEIAEQRNMFLFNITSAGPVILIGEQWKPVQLRSFPRMWVDNRFWVKGTIQQEGNQYVFTQIENVYPVISLEEQVNSEIQVLQK